MYGILDVSSQDIFDVSEINAALICAFAAPLKIESKRVDTAADSLSLKRFVSESEAQRWEIETELFLNNDAVNFSINNIVNGISNVIYIKMPPILKKYAQAIGYKNPSDTFKASDFVKNSGSISVDSIVNTDTVRIRDPFAVSIFKGDFIRFNNDSKVYLIKDLIPADPNTGPWPDYYFDLKVFPNIRVPNPETLYVGESVIMKGYYDIDLMSGITYTDGVMASPGTIRIVEKL